MNVVEETAAYERWAGARIKLVKPDLALKHRAMSESAVLLVTRDVLSLGHALSRGLS